MNKKQKALDITIKIFRVILEHHNGYSKEDIIKKELAEDCEGEYSFERIREIIEKELK